MDRRALGRTLLVDADEASRDLLHASLRAAGFEVDTAARGEDALIVAAACRPAVVILDVVLPDISGMVVCRRLRADAELRAVGVMMMKAQDDEDDRVGAFEAGTDDYLTKPFVVGEVVTRVRALARCAEERRRSSLLELGADRLKWRGLEIDASAHRTWLDGSELALRPLEFKLLSLFLENPAHVFTRGQLLKEVWGVAEYASATTVSTHLKRLRGRLGAYAPLIETVHGYGYRLGAAA